MNNVSGIYKIQSIVKPERVYVGSAVNVRKRWNVHRKKLKDNLHHSPKLQTHYDKYGVDDLVFTIIEECDRNVLIVREQFYLDTLKPWFNISPTAGNCMGKVVSEITRQKLRESNLGKKHTEETLVKMRARVGCRTGMPVSDETKQKLRKFNLGRKQSPETIEKRRQKMLGHVVSEETREKIRISNTGKVSPAKGVPRSEETKRKISLSLMGHVMPDHVKEKLRGMNTGRKLTPYQLERLLGDGAPIKGMKAIYNIQTRKRSYVNPNLHEIVFCCA